MTQRKIMFRGLTVDKKEWIYGYYLTENHLGLIKHGIHFYDRLKGHDVAIEVLPETVGQYTGLQDSKGKDIYEGDVLKCSYFKMGLGENLGVVELDAEITGVVSINELSLMLSNIVGEKWQEYTGYAEGEGETKIMYLHDMYEGSTDAEMSIEIIGNIHQNKELIKQ